MLLNGLDKIDWPNIRHSHGRATEFPTWIRQLLSDESEVRENAQENLFEYSNHQGSIYEVTPYLVPFLIELVAAEDTPDKAELLYHLASVGKSCQDTDRCNASAAKTSSAVRRTVERFKTVRVPLSVSNGSLPLAPSY